VSGRDTGATPYTETWLSVALIGRPGTGGRRDPVAVGSDIFNAHAAYVAALAAVKADPGAQKMYNDAADTLGELLAVVCTDGALAPFLAGYLRDNCPAYTPESADAFLRQWEQQRRRRSQPAAPAAPAAEPARPIEPARPAPPLVSTSLPAASDDERIAACVREGVVGQRAISRETGIPKTTVRRRLIEMGLIDA